MAKVHQLEGPSIPRTKKPPKRLDENPQTTHKFTSARELYRVKFYFHALDTTIEALKSRFHNKTSLLCRNIKYLTVSKMDGSDDALRGIKQLCDHFEGDITQPSATLAEYKILCRHVQNMKNAQKTPGLGTSKEHEGYTKHEYDKPHDNDSNDPTNNYEQIADDEKDDENDEANDEENDQVVQSVEENNSPIHWLQFSDQMTCIGPILAMTLPVTSAKAERVFSKVKIIKNCLCATMTDKRLGDLVELSIEFECAASVDIEDTIVHLSWF